MKNKYIVINKDGKLIDPNVFRKSSKCSKDFKVFIEREALGINAEDNNIEPEYLKYAKRLGFDWEPNAEIGLMQFDYKAWLIMRLMQEYARILVNKIGFPIFEVRGANIWDKSHPVVDAYAKLYGDRLFQFKSGKRNVVMSYDASYPQFNLAGKYRLNDKSLPFAHFSLSDCYRHEQSGECMLFYRNRRFFMPDLHPYFKNVVQAFEWYSRIEEQIVDAAREINREYCVIAEIGSMDDWKKYKEEIINIARNGKRDILVEIKRDGKDRYWIINVDYKVIDNFQQSREIGCIQIDVGNAKRLGIKYKKSNNKSQYPAIIHAAVPGGIERFLYMIFDNFKKCFPLWLHPIQVRLVPLSEKYLKFCMEILKENSQIRIDIDDKAESVGKRIKRAREELIPFVFVIGEKEVNGKGNVNDFKQAVERIISNSEGKPFINYNWPLLVSKQVR
jgi:threonyl-tRNA synthetase